MNVYYKSGTFYNHKLSSSLVIGFLIFVCSLATSRSIYAEVYDFNGLLQTSQGYVAESSFKSVSFAQIETTGDERALMIAQSSNTNVFGTSGDDRYIGSISFDLTPVPDLQPEGVSVIGGNDLVDVSTVTEVGGTGQDGLIEAHGPNQFGQVSRDSLSGNDWVKWNNSGSSSARSLTSKYLNLPGILAKYPAEAAPVIAYPVPEPESYAMLLAGLALIAFTARRRNHGFSN